MTTLSQAEYVHKHGQVCPCCQSGSICGGNVIVEGPAAYQEVSCDSCGAEWSDTYALTGYELTNQP